MKFFEDLGELVKDIIEAFKKGYDKGGKNAKKS